MIEDLQALEEMRSWRGEELQLPPEAQMAMKLFCSTPLCFELRASNRFRIHFVFFRNAMLDTGAALKIACFLSNVVAERRPTWNRVMA